MVLTFSQVSEVQDSKSGRGQSGCRDQPNATVLLVSDGQRVGAESVGDGADDRAVAVTDRLRLPRQQPPARKRVEHHLTLTSFATTITSISEKLN